MFFVFFSSAFSSNKLSAVVIETKHCSSFSYMSLFIFDVFSPLLNHTNEPIKYNASIKHTIILLQEEYKQNASHLSLYAAVQIISEFIFSSRFIFLFNTPSCLSQIFKCKCEFVLKWVQSVLSLYCSPISSAETGVVTPLSLKPALHLTSINHYSCSQNI